MTITPAVLVPGGLLPIAVAAQYTGPANVTTVIKRAVFTNTTAGAVKVTAYVVPSGGSADAAHEVIAARTLAAGESYPAPELSGATLGPGATLQCFSDTATAVSLVASGLQVT